MHEEAILIFVRVSGSWQDDKAPQQKDLQEENRK
jgi:hypothetical protein